MAMRALLALGLALSAVMAVDVPSAKATKSAPPVPKEFAPIVDDANLPRVLIIGDSVSVAYTLDVRKNLAGVANVHRIAANGGSTRTALGEYGLVRWLKPGEKWDVIHFNEGLHDLSYRFPDDRDKNDKGEYASPTNGGRPNVSPEQYEKNLRLIVTRLKKTGAKLIFASTTPVPEANAAKYVKDSELPYNAVAKKVMAEEGVTWNDPWAAVKPRQAELQGKRDVHFMTSGSALLAKQVSEAIARELPNPARK
jgi:acyl-CoA thioesterase-1